MLTDTLAKIAKQVGCVTAEDVAAIRSDLCNPTLPLLLKCGRTSLVVPMNELEFRMATVEREGDYVRYVSLPLADMKPWLDLGFPWRKVNGGVRLSFNPQG